MLPGMDGLEVAERLRSDPDIQIVMLTARDEIPDRIAGLRAGGDDYIVKPFDFDELLARIRAVARRRLPALSETLFAGDIVLDQERHVVTVSDAPVSLTLTEFEL